VGLLQWTTDPISQNTALFSLLGTTYGGDGKSTFALPGLDGSSPMQQGQGPGLSLRDLGELGGEQNVTLLVSEIPSHLHNAIAGTGGTSAVTPGGNVWASGLKSGPSVYSPTSANDIAMSPVATSISGGSQPHNNMMPYLVLTFCIALQGIFPSQS